MNDKASAPGFCAIGILAVAALSAGCAATDDNDRYNFGRDAMVYPTEERDADVFGNPSREYRETHPVNSFDDFDQQFPKNFLQTVTATLAALPPGIFRRFALKFFTLAANFWFKADLNGVQGLFFRK
jgi:hypothetical protein